MSQSAVTDLQPQSDRPRTNAWLLVGLFAAMLLAPLLAQTIGIGSSSQENRKLAGFSGIKRFKELKDLPRMLDTYVADRFGLRSQLVHANSMLRYRMGISSNKDIVVGKDGWLFYTADKILEQHTGADRFTAAELEKWVQRMEAARDWLESRGIAFYILVAPEKSTIYPEKLPDYPRPMGIPTRLDQLVARLSNSTLAVIDPRAALIAAKEKYPKVYSEGDSHWTQRGAFIAYTLLMARVNERFPKVVAKASEDYSISSGQSVADLASQLTLQRELRYTVERFTLRGPAHQQGLETRTWRPGWPWRIEEMRTDLADRPRLLVMGDSFTDYVLGPNLLYETFRDPVWTYHNLGTFNFNLVKEIKPEVVIFQFAERYLNSSPGIPIGFN
jgi:alginate O-acetyltransferase complex protein AlgJ